MGTEVLNGFLLSLVGDEASSLVSSSKALILVVSIGCMIFLLKIKLSL